jgi:hypothetical protein
MDESIGYYIGNKKKIKEAKRGKPTTTKKHFLCISDLQSLDEEVVPPIGPQSDSLDGQKVRLPSRRVRLLHQHSRQTQVSQEQEGKVKLG